MDNLVDTFANRISYALTIRNMKPIELAEKTNIDKSKISSYMSGRYKAKTDGLKIIADALNVSPVWLMGYDVPMEPQEYVPADLWNNTDEFGNPIAHIPILGTVKAGYNYLAQENYIGYVDVEKTLVGNGKDYFALKVHGDSMSPVLIEDDIVIIKKQNDFENGDIVVALINGDEATIKKAYKETTGIKLEAINPYYPPREFSKEEIKSVPVKIIGIVKQLKREF